MPVNAADFMWKVKAELQFTDDGWREAGWLAFVATNPDGARRLRATEARRAAAFAALPFKVRRRIRDQARRDWKRELLDSATAAMRDYHEVQETRYLLRYVDHKPRIGFQNRYEVLRDFRHYLDTVKSHLQRRRTTRQEAQT